MKPFWTRSLFPKKHVESNRNSNKAICCSTKVILCGWIIIITLQIWPSFWYGATHLVAEQTRRLCPRNCKNSTCGRARRPRSTADHFVSPDGVTKGVWQLSRTYQAAEVETVLKRGKEKQPLCVCVCVCVCVSVCVWFIIINNCVVLIRRISCCKRTWWREIEWINRTRSCSEVYWKPKGSEIIYRQKVQWNIITIYLSRSWATCWPVPVSRIQKSFQRSAIIPSASWETVFHYPG
jgi:hypothetical protein